MVVAVIAGGCHRGLRPGAEPLAGRPLPGPGGSRRPVHGTAGALLGPDITIAGGGTLMVLAMLLLAVIQSAFWAYTPSPETEAEPATAR